MAVPSGKYAVPVIFTVIGVVVIAVVFAARGTRDRPVTVATTHAVRQDLSSWIATNGKIEPIDPRIIQAQITTFIETLAVKEGQTVQPGQTLMTLDAQDLRSELARLREQLVTAEDEHRIALAGGAPDEIMQLDSDLAKTNAEIERLRRERDALDRLYAKQAATRQEVESAKAALERAEAEKRFIQDKKNTILQRSKIQTERAGLRIEETRSAIGALSAKLNSARVLAPIRGTIFALPARAGAYVHTGDVLAEMAELTRVRARVFVDEPELGSLRDGQTVEITWDALPNRTWTGVVQQLPKTIVARGSRSVGEVLCSVTNEQAELLPNTSVNSRIRTAQRQNVLALARAAVRNDGNRYYVFVVDQARLRKQQVEVGASTATDYEIVKGIAEKDVVALPGSFEFQDGMPVSIAEQK